MEAQKDHINGNGVHQELNGHHQSSQPLRSVISTSITVQDDETHGDSIESCYTERYTIFSDDSLKFQNIVKEHKIVTERRVPKLGVLLVGLGGNNGSTLVAGILANKHKLAWETKNGTVNANFFGSFTQSATCHVGFKVNEATGHLEDVYRPIKNILPMIDPCELVINGWDISSSNLYESCRRSKVLEPDLIR